MTSDNRIRVNADVNNHCPPCTYFEPEIVDYSLSWSGDECDRSNYSIDCKHRKVCYARHEWKEVRDD